MKSTHPIFERLHAGEAVPFSDAAYSEIGKVAARTMELSVELNNAPDVPTARRILSQITGQNINESTTLFTPFHVNLGIFTRIGKNVFINSDCSFLDIGGITIEDEVLIGPKVSIITEGHPIDTKDRKSLIVKPILIKRNAWIGAGATILPGVSIGENSVVAAGAVISKDVPNNCVVAGVPAKVVKRID
ncbi:MAG: sugar O-acetyltransferase [Bacteroidota bacterium]|nr:sugar O-acetyltransferase [Bacteroidota bacterium]